MSRFTFRIAALVLVLALVAVLPAVAQFIPAGPDRWVTPGDGRTFFTFPGGDVESLCGAPPTTAWNHVVKLVGVPEPGFDWDTEVTRFANADVSGGFASVPIQVTRLQFRSLGSQSTPCGKINWFVRNEGPQPVTHMDIFRTSDLGGFFRAVISLRVVFEAYKPSGAFLGKLFYTMDLPDEPNGVPWSFGPSLIFRPGIDEADNCIDVLRHKLLSATGDHVYYIEDLIAKGKCSRQ